MRALIHTLTQAINTRWQARLLVGQGQRFYRLEEYANAAACYEEALELRPQMALVRFNLGLALYKSGRKTDAHRAWETVVAETETHKPYLAEQARIMLRQFG